MGQMFSHNNTTISPLSLSVKVREKSRSLSSGWSERGLACAGELNYHSQAASTEFFNSVFSPLYYLHFVLLTSAVTENICHHFHCIWQAGFGCWPCNVISLNIATNRVQPRHLGFSPLFLQSFLKWPNTTCRYYRFQILPLLAGILLFLYPCPGLAGLTTYCERGRTMAGRC